MSEMIERMARAMVESIPVPEGHVRGEVNWPSFMAMARAALGVMREPTPGMTEAAHAASLGANEPMGPDFPKINTEIYRAMIDAALILD